MYKPGVNKFRAFTMISGPAMAAGIQARRKDILPGFAGQGIGLIHAVRPAAEVMADLVSEAERALALASRFR